MSLEIEAIAFALIAFFGWGIGDILVTITARKLDSYSATFWSLTLSILFLTLYAPFVFQQLLNATMDLIALNVILGLCLIVGIISYREGLRTDKSSLIVVIAASFTALTTIFSVIFLKEQLTNPQIITILIIFAGLILSTIDFREISKRKLLNKAVMFALISMLLWGIYFTFIKIPVKQIGWFWPNYISFLLFPLVYLYMKVRKVHLKMPTVNNAFLPLIVSIFFVRAAEFSFNIGIDKGLTAVVAPIAGASPSLYVILAFAYLKETLTKQQLIGIMITLAGIVSLSVFSI